jgi:hypothetical protein
MRKLRATDYYLRSGVLYDSRTHSPRLVYGHPNFRKEKRLFHPVGVLEPDIMTEGVCSTISYALPFPCAISGFDRARFSNLSHTTNVGDGEKMISLVRSLSTNPSSLEGLRVAPDQRVYDPDDYFEHEGNIYEKKYHFLHDGVPYGQDEYFIHDGEVYSDEDYVLDHEEVLQSKDDCYYCEDIGEYVHCDECYYCEDVQDHRYHANWSDRDQCYYTEDNTIMDYNGDHIHISNAVTLTHGEFEGEQCHESDTVRLDGYSEESFCIENVDEWSTCEHDSCEYLSSDMELLIGASGNEYDVYKGNVEAFKESYTEEFPVEEE